MKTTLALANGEQTRGAESKHGEEKAGEHETKQLFFEQSLEFKLIYPGRIPGYYKTYDFVFSYKNRKLGQN